MLSASFLPLHGCWSLHCDLCPSHFHTHSDRLFQIISALSLSFHIYSIFYWMERNDLPFGIFLFQQSATGTFISIDKFTKFCSRLHTEHYMHMINVMVYYTIDRTVEQVFFFVFMQFISHLQRKKNSCSIMLNCSITSSGFSVYKIIVHASSMLPDKSPQAC